MRGQEPGESRELAGFREVVEDGGAGHGLVEPLRVSKSQGRHTNCGAKYKPGSQSP